MSTPPGARRIDGRAIAARLREQAATARLLRQTAEAAWRAEPSRCVY